MCIWGNQVAVEPTCFAYGHTGTLCNFIILGVSSTSMANFYTMNFFLVLISQNSYLVNFSIIIEKIKIRVWIVSNWFQDVIVYKCRQAKDKDTSKKLITVLRLQLGMMLNGTFNQVTRIGLSYFFAQWKMSLLASNNYLCHRNVFQIGVNTFSKMVNHFLPKKLKILYIFCDFVQISPACGLNTYQIMYGEILDFRCQRQ